MVQKTERGFGMALSNYVEAILEEKDWYITNLSNVAACIWQELPDVSWVGFYLMKDGELVLAPFQGKVACTHIALGKGVCGMSAAEDKTLIVPDVSEFAGYIACDSEARSEIVIPLQDADGKVIGVLDIDSNTLGRFASQGEESSDLEKCAALIEKVIPSLSLRYISLH
jgi:GAF domain-containing protein